MTLIWFAFVVAIVLGEAPDNGVSFSYMIVLTEISESCSNGEPRLFKQAQTQYYGMLQICNSTQMWEAVCDYSWHCNEAIVACKQLGYTNSSKYRSA